jgi:hypothetical protein
MKKLTVFCTLLAFCLSLHAQQEILLPQDPSGKWIDGNELYIHTIDSVQVRLNFTSTSFQYWFFEIEVRNESSQDILVDPFRLKTKMIGAPKNVNPCNPAPVWRYGLGEEIQRILKKNTVEPKKTLYGVLVITRCRGANLLQISLPIGERIYTTEFKRTN